MPDICSTLQVFVGETEAQLSPSDVSLNDTEGSYYWDILGRTLSVVIKGSTIITIRTQDSVKTSLKLQTTIADFFRAKESFVDLLAGMLNIPASRIRIVDIVQAVNRRRLLAGEVTMTFVVVAEPVYSPPPPSPPPPPPPSPPPPTGGPVSDPPAATAPSEIDTSSGEDTSQITTPAETITSLRNISDTIKVLVENGSLQSRVSSDSTLRTILTVPAQTVTPELSLQPDPECIPSCKNATVALDNGVYGSCSSSGTCQCLNVADGSVSSLFTYKSVDLDALGTDNTTAVQQGCYWFALFPMFAAA